MNIVTGLFNWLASLFAPAGQRDAVRRGGGAQSPVNEGGTPSDAAAQVLAQVIGRNIPVVPNANTGNGGDSSVLKDVAMAAGGVKVAAAIPGAVSAAGAALGIGSSAAAAPAVAAEGAAIVGGGSSAVEGGAAAAGAAGAGTIAVATVGVVGVAVLLTANVVMMFQSLFGDTNPPEPQRRQALNTHMGSLYLYTAVANSQPAPPYVTNADDGPQVQAAHDWILASETAWMIAQGMTQDDVGSLRYSNLLRGIRGLGPAPLATSAGGGGGAGDLRREF